MTTWAGGDVLTAAALNSYEAILTAGTYSTNRVVYATNSTFDQSSGQVASNLTFNGSVAVSGAKQYEGISFRQLTSTLTGLSTAACIEMLHSSNVEVGSSAYNIIGSVTGTAGAGKISSIYGRAVVGSSFTGTAVALTGGVTMGASPDGVSCIANLDVSATGAYTLPMAIYISSNTAGTGTLSNGVVVGSSVTLGSSAYQWNQRAGATANFLQLYNSSTVNLFNVDYLGNLNFKTVGPALGQRIIGDFSNATLASRLTFKTATTNGNSILGVIPDGSGTISGLTAYGSSDPDNTHRITIQALPSNKVRLNAAASGTGTVPSIGYQMNGADVMVIYNTDDLVLGLAGASTGDTIGHMYIQSVAGAPTGVPTGYTGYVAMRYDRTNDKIYVYNGAWVKTGALS